LSKLSENIDFFNPNLFYLVTNQPHVILSGAKNLIRDRTEILRRTPALAGGAREERSSE
jgi:hypothetical protein